jgi:PAS domain S-box-containing protein
MLKNFLNFKQKKDFINFCRIVQVFVINYQDKERGLIMVNIMEDIHLVSEYESQYINKAVNTRATEFFRKHLTADNLEKIFNKTNEGIWFTNNKGIIKFANEQIARSLGYKVEDIIGRYGSEFLDKENSGDIISNWEKHLIERNGRYDVRLKAKDNSDRWFISNSTPFNDSKGKPIGHFTMFTDITDRKIMEKNISLQKLLFQTVIQNIQDEFIIFDELGNIILMNNKLKRHFPDYKQIKSIHDIYKKFEYYTLSGESVSNENLPGILAIRGFYSKDEVFIIRKDDVEQIISINTYPILNENPSMKLFVSHYRNITNHVNNQRLVQIQQERIIEIEKEKIEALNREMLAKDEFLNIISHEFKTPIAVISSAVQAMKVLCKDELSETSHRFLDMILQNSTRQLKLVNNLLDYSRVNHDSEILKMQNVDIVKLSNEVIESIKEYGKQKNIKISFNSTMKRKIISIDEEKYERILLNLLSNAVKFSQDGKAIDVKLCMKRVNKKNMICLKVRDEGIGIPENKIDIIFEKFGQVDSSFSRQAEGSGIGLPLVKRYIELMEGSISLDSKVGKGSIFTVLLPTKKLKDIGVKNEDEGNIRDRLKSLSDIEFSDVYF